MPDQRLKRPRTIAVADPDLKRLDRLGYLLDNSIRIPGIGYRIGYDALLGLIPGAGDVIGLMLSFYIVFEAVRLGVPRDTIGKMILNVGLESLAGLVPVVGDVFDATWKANARNVHLINQHVGREITGRPPSLRRVILLTSAIVLGIIIVAVLVVYLVVRLLLQVTGS